MVVDAVQIGAQGVGGELLFSQSGDELGNVPGRVGGHPLGFVSFDPQLAFPILKGRHRYTRLGTKCFLAQATNLLFVD